MELSDRILWFGLGGVLIAMAFIIVVASIKSLGIWSFTIGSIMFFGAGIVIARGIWGSEKIEYWSPAQRYIRSPVYNPSDYARMVDVALPNELKVVVQRLRGGE